MNKLLFLGTCACDFSDKLNNEYKDCFDKDARRSSCALINGKYLIDCGYHCLDSLRIAKINAAKITDIFITHLHDDHFSLEVIKTIAKTRESALTVWLREGAAVPELENVKWRFMRVGEKCAVNGELAVTGYAANHDKNSHPQCLLFELGEKKLLYALDGGWFINDTWNALANAQVSLMVLDCTCGDYNGDFRIGEHNTIPMVRIMLPSCKTVKLINDDTKVYVSHLAPSLHLPHEKTAQIMRKIGVEVAYDGLETEF